MVLSKATPSPTPSKLSPTLLSSSMPDTINPHYLLATPTATLPTRRSSMPTMLPPTQPLLRLGTPMPSELATPEPLMPSPQPEPQTTSTTQPPTPQTTPTMLAPMLTMLPLMLPALFATLLFQMPSLLLQRSLLVIPQADMLPPPPAITNSHQLSTPPLLSPSSSLLFKLFRPSVPMWLSRRDQLAKAHLSSKSRPTYPLVPFPPKDQATCPRLMIVSSAASGAGFSLPSSVLPSSPSLCSTDSELLEDQLEKELKQAHQLLMQDQEKSELEILMLMDLISPFLE